MGSGESKHRTSVRPPDQPLPPGKPTLVSGAPRPDPDVITIRWDPPEWNGARITGYIVEHRRIGSPHWVKATPVQIRYHQLTLSGLEPGMRYQFRVFAECATGRSEPSPLSEPIAVSYHRTFASAPCFVKPLEDTVAIENEKVEFTVQVQGTPTPKLVWYKDGFEIYSSRRQRISMDNDTSSLVIHQAAFSDEGEIKCSATNKAGHVVTKARLRLEAPPTLRLPRQYEDGLLFELGETARLKISVTGRPQPEIIWLHNGEIVTPGGRNEISTTDRYTTLKLSEATRQDRGEYQVRALNRLGEDVTSFLVTITDRPLPPGKANVVMTLGRSVTLSWSPPSDDGGCKIGNFIVEYYRIGWNMWLKAATCRQLTTTLGDLIEGSEYKFRVKAENPYGISDPSEESDVIFIPDPKRGLLEPPARDSKQLLNDDLSEEWLEARKRHNNLLNDDTKTNKKKSSKKSPETVPQWDEESPIPSPVMLANQVLTKVKMAPKRGWSDDSQGSPPRLPERPVPPKRKSKLKHMKAVEEIERIKPIKEDIPVIPDKIEYHSTEMKRVEEHFHGSSELMLVLLPNSRATTEEREAERKDTFESLKNSNTSVAPPISLSAPELGCCDPIDVSLMRFAVSSSELLHERAMARFYQETADEEAEEELKRKYGIERKRSFERSSKPKDEIYPAQKEKSSSTENIASFVQCNDDFNGFSKLEEDKNDFMPSSISPTLQESEDGDAEMFVDSEKDFKEPKIDREERFYDEVEEENIDMEVPKQEDMEEETEYFTDDLEEDTYHPQNMELGRVGVTLDRPVTPESIPSSEDSEQLVPSKFEDVLRRSESSNIDENFEDINYDDIADETLTGNSSMYERSQSPSVAQPLKPILKVRDQSQENIPKSTSFASRIIEKMTPTKVSLPNVNENISEDNKTKKKVRIEEPEDKYEEGFIGENVLLTGEVARNRRKQTRQNANEDEIDSTMVVVSHYSDIVREYGRGKKPRAKLYLDYEDLKAAADRTEREVLEVPKVKVNVSVEETVSLAQTEELQTHIPPEIVHTESREVLEIASDSEPVVVKKKSKSGSVFLLDFALFLIACWIYMFSDERLAIPILLLMVYRQVHDTVEEKINKIKNWRKKA